MHDILSNLQLKRVCEGSEDVRARIRPSFDGNSTFRTREWLLLLDYRCQRRLDSSKASPAIGRYWIAVRGGFVGSVRSKPRVLTFRKISTCHPSSTGYRDLRGEPSTIQGREDSLAKVATRLNRRQTLVYGQSFIFVLSLSPSSLVCSSLDILFCFCSSLLLCFLCNSRLSILKVYIHFFAARA